MPDDTVNGKCYQGNLNTIYAHWCRVNVLLQYTATKCKINTVYMMVITPLPHTWSLCHLLVALYDLGLLVEYCAPHNFDLKWTCLEQCRMLHMQCMWGVINEIGCSFARYRYKMYVKPVVASHLIKLKLPLVTFGSLWLPYSNATMLPWKWNGEPCLIRQKVCYNNIQVKIMLSWETRFSLPLGIVPTIFSDLPKYLFHQSSICSNFSFHDLRFRFTLIFTMLDLYY